MDTALPIDTRPLWKRMVQDGLDWLFAQVLAPLLAALLHGLCATLRWDIRGLENLQPFWGEGRPVIVCCWHGRLLMIPHAWQRHGRGRAHVLMGRNRNGELITRIVARFRMDAIRGGSRSGGEAARRMMAEAVRHGGAETLALTPDGPHGPPQVSKMGAVSLSRSLDIPLLWVSASARRAVRFGTWDRFMLPLPFSRVRVVFGPPQHPRDHAHRSLEEMRDAIDEIGREAQRRVDAW